MIIEGHEANENKIEKLLKRYCIPEEEQPLTKQLLTVVRDANVLDRAGRTRKTPFSTKTDLKPECLVLRSSKELLDFSYGLDYLSKSVGNFRDILNYKNREPGQHYQTFKRRRKKESFMKKFSQGIDEEQHIEINREHEVLEESVEYEDDDGR